MATAFDLSFWNKNPTELKEYLKTYIDTIQTSKLQPLTVTYSFYTDQVQPPASMMADLLKPDQMPAATSTPIYKAFTLAEQQQTRAVFDYLSHATGLKFSEVTAGTGNIRMGEYNMKGSTAGYTFLPTEFDTTDPTYAPLFINSNPTLVDNLREFTQTIWHELGHAIGLKHPAKYGTGDTAPVLPAAIDTSLLSIMSYDDYKYGVSYAPLDLMALVNMYGANKNQPGMNYIFTRTADLDGLQSIKGNDYTINLPTTAKTEDNVTTVSNSVFWAYVNPGKDKIDVSQCKLGDQGVVVDDRIGAISWSTDVKEISIYDYAASTWTTGNPISNFANIRLYTAAEQTTKALSELKLTDQKDIVKLSHGGMMGKILSGGGNDQFSGFDGGATIDGDIGQDHWLLDGMRADYQLRVSVDGNTLTNLQQETMTFSNVDRLNFADSSLAFDYLGDAGAVYRLYSVFDRKPDAVGLGYWIEQADQGEALTTIAQNIMNSPEFSQIYGPDNSPESFITAIYAYVLGRTPDAEGLTYWTNTLNQGDSRSNVVVAITQSLENTADKIGVVATGIEYQPWIG